MASFNHIDVQQLLRRIGLPDAPLIVDVRFQEDVDTDPTVIPGAQRIAHTDIALVAALSNQQGIAVYCQKGRKLSQGAAAILREMGMRAEVLDGGHLAWRDAKAPLIPISSLPPQEPGSRSCWVTRHRPKVDRIACPWLIRRFVDANARFLFVPPADVQAVAERFSATPFDTQESALSHKGEQCSFDAMLEHFDLRTPALSRLALIVRGADTNRLDLVPECSGFLAALLGLSRMHRDDTQQLDAAMPILDAFYRWARDASDESHDCPRPELIK